MSTSTAAATAAEPTPSGKPPVDKVRISNIAASIWQNSGANGNFYSVTFERSYKDGDKWKNTQSFGREDLLELARVAEKAFDKIVDLQQTKK